MSARRTSTVWLASFIYYHYRDAFARQAFLLQRQRIRVYLAQTVLWRVAGVHTEPLAVYYGNDRHYARRCPDAFFSS